MVTSGRPGSGHRAPVTITPFICENDEQKGPRVVVSQPLLNPSAGLSGPSRECSRSVYDEGGGGWPDGTTSTPIKV